MVRMHLDNYPLWKIEMADATAPTGEIAAKQKKKAAQNKKLQQFLILSTINARFALIYMKEHIETELFVLSCTWHAIKSPQSSQMFHCELLKAKPAHTGLKVFAWKKISIFFFLSPSLFIALISLFPSLCVSASVHFTLKMLTKQVNAGNL